MCDCVYAFANCVIMEIEYTSYNTQEFTSTKTNFKKATVIIMIFPKNMSVTDIVGTG